MESFQERLPGWEQHWLQDMADIFKRSELEQWVTPDVDQLLASLDEIISP